jgi:RES domain-containing protein
MSSSTWTRDGLLASTVAVETTAWRMVEAQHKVSTMKLVDTLDEQEALEQLLDGTKPLVPDVPKGMGYLLYTPFRYSAQNPFASRFRKSNAPDGVFYASASPETAVAEMAFYRRLFFAESPGTPYPKNPEELTAFAVQIRTKQALDLTRPTLNDNETVWTDPNDYSQCHSLADTARGAGIEVITYASVRDQRHGVNYAVLSPDAFAQMNPVATQTWRMHVREDGGVLAKCESPAMGITFAKSDFDIESRLKASGLKVA